MQWPPWPKANELDLARYVNPDAAPLRLEVNRHDLSQTRNGRRCLVQAIYDALLQARINYAPEKYSPHDALQNIRHPQEILQARGEGTCLDLALLFAAACLAYELLPLVVVIEGHAFTAVSLVHLRREWDDFTRGEINHFHEGKLTEGNELLALVDAESYLAIECTGFARSQRLHGTHPEDTDRVDGCLTFEQAVTAGRRQLTAPERPFRYALDIATLHELGVTPPNPIWEQQFQNVLSASAATLNRAHPCVLLQRPDLKTRFDKLLKRHTLFGGRKQALDRLDALVAEQQHGYFFVKAPSGFGKTALLANWTVSLRMRKHRVCYHFISHVDDATDERFVLTNLCEQLATYHRLEGNLTASLDGLRALYPALLKLPPADGQPIIVVLDGLDEAPGWVRSYLFPDELPAHVLVVFSARVVADIKWVKELELPLPAERQLTLDTLLPTDIAHLLTVASGPATALAAEDDFVKAMYTASKGDPFYVHFLVQDVLAGHIQSVADLQQQPDNLDDYLDHWWAEVAPGMEEQGATFDLFAYLLVARGPLPRKELIHISAKDRLSGQSFIKALQRVQRFVVGNHDDGYALCHPRFREHIAKEWIQEDQQKPYRENLLAWCKLWREHRSPYALRNYALHLKDYNFLDALYSIACHGEFLAMQAARIPHEPDLALRTTEIALTEAVHTDDAGAMAQLLLAHAQQATALLRQSPLTILRSSPSSHVTQGAAITAVRHWPEPSERLLWSILLAWEMAEHGEKARALAHLQSLESEPWPGVSAQLGEATALALAHLFPLDRQACMAIGRQALTPADCFAILCQALARSGQFQEAIDIACSCDQAAQILEGIIDEQVKRGQLAEAWKLLASTSYVGRLPSWLGKPLGAAIAEGWLQLAAARMENGERLLAQEAAAQVLQILDRIDRAEAVLSLWVRLAKLQSWLEDRRGCAQSLRQALAIAKGMSPTGPYPWNSLNDLILGSLYDDDLRDVCLAYADLGWPKQAHALVQEIVDPKRKVTAMTMLAARHADRHHVQSARRLLKRAAGMIEKIATPRDRVGRWVAIAAAYVHCSAQRQATRAFTVAMQEADDSPTTLAEVGAALIRSGRTKDGCATFERALTLASDRLESLLAIAKIQANVGHIDEARDTFRRAQGVAETAGPGHQRERLRSVSRAEADAGLLEEAITTANILVASEERYGEPSWGLALMLDIARQAAARDRSDLAGQLLTEIERKAEDLRDQSYIFFEVVETWITLQRFAEAKATAGKIAWSKRRTEALLKVVAGEAMAGRLADAEVTRQLALAAATTIGNLESHDKTHLLVNIAWQQVVQGEGSVQDCRQVRDTLALILHKADEIDEEQWIVATLTDMGRLQAGKGKGRVEEAITTLHSALEQAERARVPERVRSKVAIAFADIGEVARAEGLLAQAGHYQQAIFEALFRAHLRRAAASSGAEGKRALEQADEIAWAIYSSIHGATGVMARIEVAQAQYAAGLTAESEETFAQAEQSIQFLGSSSERDAAYREIVAFWARASNSVRAVEITKQINDRAELSRALTEIVLADYRAGGLKAGDRMLATITAFIDQLVLTDISEDTKCTIIMNMIHRLVQDGGDAAVERSLSSLFSKDHLEQWKWQAWYAICFAQADRGDPSAAAATLAILESARTQEFCLQERVDLYVQLGIAWAKANAPTRADAMFSHACKLVEGIADLARAAKMLGPIAIAAAQAGRGERALWISDRIVVERNTWLPEIAKGLADSKDKEPFKRLLIPCSLSIQNAYRMVAWLICFYPEWGDKISRIVSGYEYDPHRISGEGG